MSDIFKGKGFWTWILERCEGGDPVSIADEAVKAGHGHILIKIADGIKAYQLSTASSVVNACKAAGLQVWGWQYIYLDSPASEAGIAIKRISELNLDGFVINAEVECKFKNSAAVYYTDALRAGLPAGFPVGLSSYRFPQYHQEFPWTEFLSRVDVNLPQVYWIGAHNPTHQLNVCVSEFQNPKYPQVPIVPTGAAFRNTDGWEPTEADVKGFLTACDNLGLKAYNFWEWGNTREHEENLWQIIADWKNDYTPEPEPQPDPDEEEEEMETLTYGVGLEENSDLDYIGGDDFAVIFGGDLGRYKTADGVKKPVINNNLKPQIEAVRNKMPVILHVRIHPEDYVSRSEGMDRTKWDPDTDPLVSKMHELAYLDRLVRDGVSAIMFEPVIYENGNQVIKASWWLEVTKYYIELVKSRYNLPAYFVFIRPEHYEKLRAKQEGTEIQDFAENIGSFSTVKLGVEPSYSDLQFTPDLVYYNYSPSFKMSFWGCRWDQSYLWSMLKFTPSEVGPEPEPEPEPEEDEDDPEYDDDDTQLDRIEYKLDEILSFIDRIQGG